MIKIVWLVDILFYTHKQLTDNCDLIELAGQFCAVLDEHREHFGHLYSSVFSSHLIYQILMIINIPTNTLHSAYASPPPPPLLLPFKN